MAKLIVSLNIYQINTAKLGTPRVMGIPFSDRTVVKPTHSGNTVLDSKVGVNVYSCIEVPTGMNGVKYYYTDTTVADIITAVNS